MLTLLTLVFALAGLLKLPASPWGGVALLALSCAVHRRATFDEEAFVAVLATLAAFGAIAITAEGLWLELIGSR